MRKLLQINITANWGSHGKIAEAIGQQALSLGWESHIAYGRWSNPSQSSLYHIGSMADEYIHGVFSRIFDNHGLMSAKATKELVKYIQQINPDIIHLHNIHGYYLNYPILFDFLATFNKPVVWTLHDCWSFTGHCAHYMFANCKKWETGCHHCPLLSNYPRSFLLDHSKRNYELKKKAFSSVNNLTIIPVSQWLSEEVSRSFLKNKERVLIYNGIDTDFFSPADNADTVKAKYSIPVHGKIVLGVASNWYRKGLEDFTWLRELLPNDYYIVLVGVSAKDKMKLPKTIIGIERTENVQELISLYSAANVFFNPTWEDNFPTVNLEALSCGTPIVTYQTGGSSESITPETGNVVPRGDLTASAKIIKSICESRKKRFQKACRERVVMLFSKQKMLDNYMQLYNSLSI